MLVLLAFLLMAASPIPAHASWMVPGYPWRPKDFTLIKHDGLYHLFYIRYNWLLPAAQTENDLGHATSPDLWNWTQAPTVLPARDTSWDRTHIWAPSIVERDGVFYMFYTGVSTIPDTCNTWQRIGVATSTDLMEWTRLDAPIYSCTEVPWTVCDSASTNTAFRDPFVMPDPAQPGHWLMYYSAYPASDSLGMVVGMAASDGDPDQWDDLGPLWITHRSYTYNSRVESPHLFKHAGLWYVFYTTDADQAISFSTGPDPVGVPASWTYRGRLATMLGVDTKAWYASEQFSDGLVDYFACVIGDRIDVKRMVWGSGWQFNLAQPDWMHVRAMSWDRGSVAQGGTATLSIVAANWQVAPVHLEALRLRSDGTQVAVPLASLGLPGTLTLTGDTTRVVWNAAWLADQPDTARLMPLLLRLTDQTAAAPVLTVVGPPRPLYVTALAWDSASVAVGDTARLEISALNWTGRSVSLEALRVRGGGSQVPLPLDSLGLPASVALTADVTRLAWGSRWLPDEPDSTRYLQLLVRSTDPAAAAPLLTVVGPPRPLQVLSMSWDSARVMQGDTATLAIAALNWAGRSVSLEALRVRADDSQSPLPLDSLGLPASVALTSDTTRLVWRAVWRADEPDTSRLLRLLVRSTDPAAAAPLLTVVGPPPPLHVTALAWDRASVAVGDSATLAIAAFNWVEHSVNLEALRVRSDSVQVPVPPDTLGLPATVTLTGDTTRVVWHSAWLADEPDTSRLMPLLLRLGGQPAAAPALVVVGLPRPLYVTAISWDSVSVAVGETATLSVTALNWAERSVGLEALRVRGDGSRVPLQQDSLGLPATVPLTGSVTRLSWSSRWLPDVQDTTRIMRLLVRLTGPVADAPLLTVIGPPRPGEAPDPPSEPDQRPLPHGFRFSAVARPFGEQRAVLIELGGPARARLDVFDAQGRRLRNLVDGELPGGATMVLWDGRDAAGMAVGAGVYFARLTTPLGARTVRVVQLR